MLSGWIFAVLAGLFGYQVHGWLGAIIAALAIPVLTISANMLYASKFLDSDRDAISDFQKIKWGVFILVMVVIAASGASFVSQP